MDAGRCCCVSMNASNDSFIFVPIRRAPLKPPGISDPDECVIEDSFSERIRAEDPRADSELRALLFSPLRLLVSTVDSFFLSPAVSKCRPVLVVVVAVLLSKPPRALLVPTLGDADPPLLNKVLQETRCGYKCQTGCYCKMSRHADPPRIGFNLQKMSFPATYQVPNSDQFWGLSFVKRRFLRGDHPALQDYRVVVRQDLFGTCSCGRKSSGGLKMNNFNSITFQRFCQWNQRK